MTEREGLERAIAAMEAQRATLGDAAVEAALTGLRQQLAALEAFPPFRSPEGRTTGGEAERKLVTVMFAEILGFTAMAEQSSPTPVLSGNWGRRGRH
jgi:class 3 adenylate cyclase